MIVIYSSCNENQNLGLDILPEDDLLNATISDTFEIEAYTVKSEHLSTSSGTTLLLGSFIDPIFGGVKSSFAAQFLQTTYPYFPEDIILNDFKLYLPLKTDDKYLGDISVPQEFFVYRLTETLSIDSVYYSNENPSDYHQGELIGQATITSTDTVTVLAITLSDELAMDFIDNEQTYFYTGLDQAFYDVFKGIYVTTNDEINDAAIYKIDFTSSEFRMQLDYHRTSSPDTIEYTLPVKTVSYYGENYSARFSVFEHDHTNAVFYEQLINPFTIQDDLAYIQAMGGTKVRLNFINLSKLNEDKNVVINKAELVVKTDENQTNQTNYLSIVGYTEDDKIVFFEDFYNTSTGDYYGATFNEDDKEYRFNLTRVVQGIVDNEEQDFDFYLVDKAASYDYNSTVITTASHENKMKLVITYSKYK